MPPIKDNPGLSELKKDAEQFRVLRSIWPLIKPFARVLRIDTKSIDKTLDEAMEIARRVDELIEIPDRFNDMFSEVGWILFESLDLTVAKQALEIAETVGMEAAEEFLTGYFSPAWVESRMTRLENIKGFRERFELARLALEDYKAGRFYASVQVTLSLIDGWVNELNIVDFQRHGFFSEDSRLVAWDSIAAHPKGLSRLQEVFGKSRMMTRTEEIRIPYRNGIVHGMDLGYNNKYVAAKCWSALFAIRDWAVKAARNELQAPKMEPKAEKTLWESIENLQKVRRQAESLKRWQPRVVIVGESIPVTGQSKDYPPDTPEQKLVEFLSFWSKNNYGYMAKCHVPFLRMTPADIRDAFSRMQLLGFELMEVNEVSAAIADIKVALKLRRNDEILTSVYEFRLALSNEAGDIAFLAGDATKWGITTWRHV